ncbi:hypothetical protein EC957_000540 [Mortierella hygrophila]|uniref:Uncharacterized protein n=1 Tax=Mortierella hygrophila TaxID=979708 RepID=A0A9P6K2U6_9FUNG|nr:hypothetical protein EC957_000540 [Mortierella hygrophila]
MPSRRLSTRSLEEGTAIANAVYQDPKLCRAVLKEIILAGQAANLKRQPRGDIPFLKKRHADTDLKIKRHPVVHAYRKQIDELYREIHSGADLKL